MFFEFLIVMFLYIIISDISRKYFKPLREGATNQECSDALKLSKKNAGNLTYIDDELKRLDVLAKNMKTLDGKVENNARSLAQISESHEKRGDEMEKKLPK